ncbi:MAG TPA: nucleoside kinase, partial [Anaerolineales bacterium]|nr:nucleoside kinase [Anaerolineales bacterium]
MTVSQEFYCIEPRPTVEIHLPDGRVFCGPRGAPVGTFLKALNGGPPGDSSPPSPPIVGAIVNYELRELTYPITIESIVQPVTMGEADGMRIYRRSLTFVLEAAFEELFPAATITIDHSVSSGGYYCEVIGRPPLSPVELEHLEGRMREIVAADLPLPRQKVPLPEAIAYFQSKG